jgi:Ni/Co efflux regulator RcnB
VNLTREVTIMRPSLLSLLLLTAATTATSAAAQTLDEQPADQSEAVRVPERREEPPRPEPTERAERRYEDADRSPVASPARRDLPQTFGAEASEAPRPERQERVELFEQRQPLPDPVRSVAAAATAQQRGEDADRPAREVTPVRRRLGGVAGSGWRGGNGERRARERDLPPSAGSPVFGSAIPNAVTVTQPTREVSTGSVAAGGLRDRIAAEGLRRDRIERDSWRRDWRQDRRYDWRRTRDRDRSRFHLGIYIDPFGWRYRDWNVGWRLPARYYQSRYWIHDPYYYRLPPVGGPYRWIRYHDDVLLVDLRSGRVLDRIRGFFW